MGPISEECSETLIPITLNFFPGAKSEGISTNNPGKVCADRIQFQLTLHEEEEEDNQATSETFDSTIVSGHQRDDHTMV